MTLRNQPPFSPSVQVVTSAGLVRRLLEEQYPVLAGEPIADVPMHGTDTDVYRVGDRHCVRLPIVTWAFDQQERVRPWLPWLRDRLSLPPAVPEFYGAPACGYPAPWCVQQWVPGRRLQPGSDDAGLAVEIADFLREHGRGAAEDGFPGGPAGDVRGTNSLTRTNWFNGRYLTA